MYTSELLQFVRDVLFEFSEPMAVAFGIMAFGGISSRLVELVRSRG